MVTAQGRRGQERSGIDARQVTALGRCTKCRNTYPHGRKRHTVPKFAVTDGDIAWTSTLFCFPACNGLG